MTGLETMAVVLGWTAETKADRPLKTFICLLLGPENKWLRLVAYFDTLPSILRAAIDAPLPCSGPSISEFYTQTSPGGVRGRACGLSRYLGVPIPPRRCCPLHGPREALLDAANRMPLRTPANRAAFRPVIPQLHGHFQKCGLWIYQKTTINHDLALPSRARLVVTSRCTTPGAAIRCSDSSRTVNAQCSFRDARMTVVYVGAAVPIIPMNGAYSFPDRRLTLHSLLA
ncbi:hypothetical protein C8Q78DRAFT_637470 [Trametes maxima]|nr:hypothetical protein C8Q78DRAFT_637470 [Trametes maxima]